MDIHLASCCNRNIYEYVLHYTTAIWIQFRSFTRTVKVFVYFCILNEVKFYLKLNILSAQWHKYKFIMHVFIMLFVKVMFWVLRKHDSAPANIQTNPLL